MIGANKLTAKFPARQFPENATDDTLKTGEINIVWQDRIAVHKAVYDKFNTDFKLFLTKLSDNNVKKYVENVFNKNLIFVGISKRKTPAIFSRLLLTNTNRIAGIVLDSFDLEINLSTGESNNIDDCIYAVYYSLIRSGVILNSEAITKNKELHKNLIIYLNQSFLRILGKGLVYNEKQKEYIKCICIYIFHRHFLQQRHLAAISALKKNYKDITNSDFLKEIADKLEEISKYSTVQDIPKMLIDHKIIYENPNNIIMNMLKIFGTPGFYHLIGSLDLLIGFIVISRYPTNLFNKSSMISEKLHKTVEDIMLNYVKQISYDTKIIPKEY